MQPGKCDVSMWKVISNLLDINFIHGDIQGWSFKKNINNISSAHGVDIPSAGVPYLNVMRWGSSKILDMLV